MKRLIVCLLLVGVVGCGTSPSPEPPRAQDDRSASLAVQDESPEPPPVETDVEKAKREYEKGVGFIDREDWAAAVACFTEVIRILPDQPPSHDSRGDAFARFEEYDKTNRIDPDYAKIFLKRGWAHRELGNNEKANADAAKAKELGYEP